jgi:hypothetical protein
MSHSSAAQAGHGTGSGDDEVARGEAAVLRGLQHLPQRLVPQDEPFFSRRRVAEAVVGDLGVGAADADQARLNQDRPIGGRWLRQVDHAGGLRTAWNDGDRFHRPNISRGCAI